jgi:RNA polymerase sigma factor
LDDIDYKAIQAAKDARRMDEFLRENESFVLKCAYWTVHRYITKSDDEWSIAFTAFSQAVKDYSMEKGSFTLFAKMVIRRRLIDYLRAQSKYRVETSVNPSVFDSETDEEDADNTELEVQAAIYSNMENSPGDSLKLEIELANRAFTSYGFSFFDLAECSPKAEKTKKACAKAVVYIIRNPVLLSGMRNSKMLPLKMIEINTGVPRKILERHRKYIIAATEIITGDYPCLAEYMRFIREELSRDESVRC